ncbi:TIGR03862 family flavoprotein [Rhizobium sp. SG2393]|uniref:TIGR03862 family flavoprotein n=1 Tax=Rhizobium sp. SG2393 TaxID=3276279 RepID=UPI00366B2B6B
MESVTRPAPQVAIVGGGPAGLMAAEVLARAGIRVTVYDAMPSVARKLLLAGKSGLNITHSEPHARLRTRFGAAGGFLAHALDAMTGRDVEAFAAGLGVETFTGSSGRVFPVAMKASPLLRAWLARLAALGVKVRTRHRWTGFDGQALRFETPEGLARVTADAVLLALGGASWPRLGSDAAWVPLLAEKGVTIAPFRPANCGFDVRWSEMFATRFAGAPVKSVATPIGGRMVKGEFVVTGHGIEGSLVYAACAALRDRLLETGKADFVVDLAPDRTVEALAAALHRQAPKLSFSNRLRRATGLDGVKAALLREVVPDLAARDASALAEVIKALPIPLASPRPIAEAISSAGGIRLDAVGADYQLMALPGVFAAGEMLDWEAPTGGYLLTACFGTGQAAARGVLAFLGRSLP